MKPLVLGVLCALACVPGSLRAQPGGDERADVDKRFDAVKKKYANGGQKPAVAPANGPDRVSPDGGMAIADLEALLLKSSNCKKHPEDTALLAAGLKGKYGLVACMNDIDGLRQIVLVPKSPAVPAQQLAYGSAPGYKLLRGRLVDHYLVLQFDKQVQYLDLLKQDKDAKGADVGFAFSGFVADQRVSRFEDVRIFKDALINYAGVKADSDMMTRLPALVAKAVGSKRYGLQGSKANDAWIIVATSEGAAFGIWPQPAQGGGSRKYLETPLLE